MESLITVLSFFNRIFFITGNIIHFLISLFSKHTVFIDEEDKLTVKGKKINTQSIQLKDVKHVVFDQGEVSRHRCIKPCSITMHTHSNSLTINNPSFFMMCQLRKRLKNATFKFNNYKSYIILFSIFTTISLIISIIFRILLANI